MFFRPAVAISGLPGWRVLQATQERQQAAFERSAFVAREIEYFRENAASATSADDLTKDRRLLGVALGAYGLSDEINKRAFVRQVLEGGTEETRAFANRLPDQRYREFAFNFDYGNDGGVAGLKGDAITNEIIERYNAEARTPLSEADAEDFRTRMRAVTSTQSLVDDPTVLGVVLGAFGLGDDVDNPELIQLVLNDGAEGPDALANQLSNPGYAELARIFNFGDQGGGAGVKSEVFREAVIGRYLDLEFERAVGEVDPDMRLAMNFQRQIEQISNSPSAERTGWFQIMGQAPLRELVATALGVPQSASQLDLDQQREIFERRAQQVFGTDSVEAFQDPENVDKMIRRFFLFRQIENGPSASTPGAGALTLLQSSALSGAAAANLILSQR